MLLGDCVTEPSIVIMIEKMELVGGSISVQLKRFALNEKFRRNLKDLVVSMES